MVGVRGVYHEVPENGLLELNVPEVGRSLLLDGRAFYSAEHHVKELHHQHPIGFLGYRGPECSHFLRRETAWKGLALVTQDFKAKRFGGRMFVLVAAARAAHS
jgi:hypothetical protein